MVSTDALQSKWVGKELRRYLEKYAVWPSEYFRDRARKVEQSLAEWGRRLYYEAMPSAHTANLMQVWARIGDHAGRRFSVHVDTAVEAGAADAETGAAVAAAREAATLLLGLPWELRDAGPLRPPYAQSRPLPLPERSVGRGGARGADGPLG